MRNDLTLGDGTMKGKTRMGRNKMYKCKTPIDLFLQVFYFFLMALTYWQPHHPQPQITCISLDKLLIFQIFLLCSFIYILTVKRFYAANSGFDIT